MMLPPRTPVRHQTTTNDTPGASSSNDTPGASSSVTHPSSTPFPLPPQGARTVVITNPGLTPAQMQAFERASAPPAPPATTSRVGAVIGKMYGYLPSIPLPSWSQTAASRSPGTANVRSVDTEGNSVPPALAKRSRLIGGSVPPASAVLEMANLNGSADRVQPPPAPALPPPSPGLATKCCAALPTFAQLVRNPLNLNPFGSLPAPALVQARLAEGWILLGLGRFITLGDFIHLMTSDALPSAGAQILGATVSGLGSYTLETTAICQLRDVYKKYCEAAENVAKYQKDHELFVARHTLLQARIDELKEAKSKLTWGVGVASSSNDPQLPQEQTASLQKQIDLLENKLRELSKSQRLWSAANDAMEYEERHLYERLAISLREAIGVVSAGASIAAAASAKNGDRQSLLDSRLTGVALSAGTALLQFGIGAWVKSTAKWSADNAHAALQSTQAAYERAVSRLPKPDAESGEQDPRRGVLDALKRHMDVVFTRTVDAAYGTGRSKLDGKHTLGEFGLQGVAFVAGIFSAVGGALMASGEKENGLAVIGAGYALGAVLAAGYGGWFFNNIAKRLVNGAAAQKKGSDAADQMRLDPADLHAIAENAKNPLFCLRALAWLLVTHDQDGILADFLVEAGVHRDDVANLQLMARDLAKRDQEIAASLEADPHDGVNARDAATWVPFADSLAQSFDAENSLERTENEVQAAFAARLEKLEVGIDTSARMIARVKEGFDLGNATQWPSGWLSALISSLMLFPEQGDVPVTPPDAAGQQRLEKQRRLEQQLLTEKRERLNALTASIQGDRNLSDEDKVTLLAGIEFCTNTVAELQRMRPNANSAATILSRQQNLPGHISNAIERRMADVNQQAIRDACDLLRRPRDWGTELQDAEKVTITEAVSAFYEIHLGTTTSATQNRLNELVEKVRTGASTAEQRDELEQYLNIAAASTWQNWIDETNRKLRDNTLTQREKDALVKLIGKVEEPTWREEVLAHAAVLQKMPEFAALFSVWLAEHETDQPLVAQEWRARFSQFAKICEHRRLYHALQSELHSLLLNPNVARLGSSRRQGESEASAAGVVPAALFSMPGMVESQHIVDEALNSNDITPATPRRVVEHLAHRPSARSIATNNLIGALDRDEE